MDHLTPFYDEGIAEKIFNLEQFDQGMSHTEVNQFIHKLLSTIDLSRLAEVFFAQLKARTAVLGLVIQYDDQVLRLGEFKEQCLFKTLACADNGKVIANLHYAHGGVLSSRDWQILQQMHLYFCSPLKNALEHHKVKQFAMKDFLTSLGNRASYSEAIVRLLNHAERYQSQFGLLVLDLDNFKQVNDKFGHDEGDKVLMACATTINACLRESDFAFRFGGDEFCCLLPDTNALSIQLVAQRICAAISQNSLLQRHRVSCSIGSTEYQPQDNPQSIFARADAALYQAKQSGRNCIKAA